MNTDGGASHAHTLPKIEGWVPKNILSGPKCCRVFWFTAGLLLCSISFMASSLAPICNMMLTTLLGAPQIMDPKLAGTVHLKVDGGSENWNSTVLAVLDLLFDMYPELKEIVVFRFARGTPMPTWTGSTATSTRCCSASARAGTALAATSILARNSSYS
jgi:hypothetical protein